MYCVWRLYFKLGRDDKRHVGSQMAGDAGAGDAGHQEDDHSPSKTMAKSLVSPEKMKMPQASPDSPDTEEHPQPMSTRGDDSHEVAAGANAETDPLKPNQTSPDSPARAAHKKRTKTPRRGSTREVADGESAEPLREKEALQSDFSAAKTSTMYGTPTTVLVEKSIADMEEKSVALKSDDEISRGLVMFREINEHLQSLRHGRIGAAAAERRQRKSTEECSVCLMELGCHAECVTLACRHTFHAFCIVETLGTGSCRSCPLCRTVVAKLVPGLAPKPCTLHPKPQTLHPKP